MHNQHAPSDVPNTRISSLERTVRLQGRALMVMGGLFTLAIFAGATMRAADATHVVIDKPVKIVLDDISYRVRGSHALPVTVTTAN